MSGLLVRRFGASDTITTRGKTAAASPLRPWNLATHKTQMLSPTSFQGSSNPCLRTLVDVDRVTLSGRQQSTGSATHLDANNVRSRRTRVQHHVPSRTGFAALRKAKVRVEEPKWSRNTGSKDQAPKMQRGSFSRAWAQRGKKGGEWKRYRYDIND